jgi:hypothetical protein
VSNALMTAKKAAVPPFLRESLVDSAYTGPALGAFPGGGLLQTMGEQNARGFVALYMVPGMEHCSHGPGPNSFGQLGTTTAKTAEHGIYDALEAG